MEFWVVPNSQGLPTVNAAAIVADGGPGPQAGKGALLDLGAPGFSLSPGGGGSPVVFNRVDYDDLGFTDLAGNPTKIFLPDVDPPIRRVNFNTIISWAGSDATELTMLVRRDPGLFLDDGLTFDTKVATGSGQGHTANSATVDVSAFPPGTFWQFIASHNATSAQTIAKASFCITVER